MVARANNACSIQMDAIPLTIYFVPKERLLTDVPWLAAGRLCDEQALPTCM